MGKKYYRMIGGGPVAIKIDVSGRQYIIYSTRHDENQLSYENLRKIAYEPHKEAKVCYLIESNKKLKKNEYRNPNHGDFTTKKILLFLKKEYKELYKNLCIRGWDVRQSIIGQRWQNKLYHKPYDITVGEIINYYIMENITYRPQG